jgi:hypothetical protein
MKAQRRDWNRDENGRASPKGGRDIYIIPGCGSWLVEERRSREREKSRERRVQRNQNRDENVRRYNQPLVKFFS